MSSDDFRLLIDTKTGWVVSVPDTGEDRVRAASYLTILSTELPGAELERLVGLTADQAWNKGEPRRSGARKTHRFSGAHYESGLDERAAPAAHVRALVERLAPFAQRIASVADLGTTHARFWIVEHTEAGFMDTAVAPTDVAVVAAMHAELTFSSYFYDSEEEE
jgi:hypothetical protein